MADKKSELFEKHRQLRVNTQEDQYRKVNFPSLKKSNFKKFEPLKTAKTAQFQQISKRVHSREHISNECCKYVAITKADFGDNQDQTYYITAPGKYTLSEDIIFNGNGNFTPAILIFPGVNNVTLDLCEHTLSQGNDAPFTYGIWIGFTYFDSGFDEGNDNITIQNGSVVGFSATAILAYSNRLDLVYSNLHFNNLNILNNGIIGENVDFLGIQGLSLAGDFPLENRLEAPFGSEDAVFKNIVIENVRVNNSIGGVNGAFGIVVFAYDNLIIKNTQSNGTRIPYQDGNTFGGCFGIQLAGINLQMTNCQANDTRLEDFNFTQTGGLDHESSQNSYIKDCQFNNGYGLASFIVNNNISAGVNIVFENVQFNNNQGGIYAAQVYGAHGSGFPDLKYDGRNYKFINCQFNSASFEEGQVSQLITLGGLFTQNISQITVDNCEVRDLKITGTSFNTARVAGIRLSSQNADIPSNIGDANDLVIRNCIISDFRNIGGSATVGIQTGGTNDINAYGEQVVHYNTLIENCTVQRIFGLINSDLYEQAPLSTVVAGIGDVNMIYPNGYILEVPDFPGNQGALAKRFNTVIKNCVVTDVHSVVDNQCKKVISKSAGIIVESVENAIVTDNQVTNCDRGILFTGTDDVIPGPAGSNIPDIPTCFQVAATKEDALATPPNFIPLLNEYLMTNKPGLGPFVLTRTVRSPPLTVPITAVGGLAVPLNACSGPAGNVNGKIGIVQFLLGSCGSVALVNNAQAGGDVATILINTQPPVSFAGSFDQYNASVSYEDGQVLINALTADPTIVLTITNNSFNVPGATITNVTRGNSVTLSGAQLARDLSFLCTDSNLNKLCWQSGDKLVYNANGNANIAPLVSDQTYYLIVYRPGFVLKGLVKDNEVTSCTVAGFEDTYKPCTDSLWLNNTAYCNGPKGKRNYVIHWSGEAPITKGNLTHYPEKSKFKQANISVSCDKCSCTKQKPCDKKPCAKK
jgi:hypothetical protein